MTIVGSDIPTGDEVKWYSGGASATLISAEELVADASGNITLSKIAEFGSVFVVDASDDPTEDIIELDSDASTPATEATGSKVVGLNVATPADASGNTYYAYYLDTETTSLVQIMACKDVSSSMDIDTKETEVHGQTQKLQKTGAASRTVSLEEVDYNDTFIIAMFGDTHANSPATGKVKWIDNFTGVRKISGLVGKQTVDGTLTKMWYLMGCQASSIEHSFPTADYYAKSMEFLVDYMLTVDLS